MCVPASNSVVMAHMYLKHIDSAMNNGYKMPLKRVIQIGHIINTNIKI